MAVGKALSLAVLAAALVGAPGCKKDRQQDGTAARTVLRIATFEPKNYDPAALVDGLGRELVENLFEGLTARDPAGAPIPGCAASWTTSPDGLTWTFNLRPGLVWSDGKELTSADFVYSFRRAMDPQTTHRQATMSYPIKTAEAIHKGDIKELDALGVTAPDAATLVIALERPYPALLKVLRLGYTAPSPRHVVEAYGDQWTRPGNIVSNGPFVLTEHQDAQFIKLAKNPKYHAAADVSLLTVEFKFTSDNTTAWQWYELDEVDWVAGLVPDEKIQALRKTNDPALRIDPYNGLSLLFLNAEKVPTSDVRLRRAVDLALDRGVLTRQILGNGELPSDALVPSSVTEARPPMRVRYDPAAAKKLLVESGFDPASRELELIYNTNAKNKQLAEFIQRNLKENLGLRVRVRNLDWKTYLEELGSPTYDLGIIAMGGFDALDFMQLVRGDSEDNRARWKNDTYDALIGKARSATSESAQTAVVEDALKILDAHQPIVAMYQLTRRNLLRPGFQGFEYAPDNAHMLRWFKWKAP